MKNTSISYTNNKIHLCIGAYKEEGGETRDVKGWVEAFLEPVADMDPFLTIDEEGIKLDPAQSTSHMSIKALTFLIDTNQDFRVDKSLDKQTAFTMTPTFVLKLAHLLGFDRMALATDVVKLLR